ncbi:hypothetical protein P7C71_g4020, partial [Lecanoromycetidae sp. Uapishka_2]
MSTSPPIIILGAGISGLALGQALKNASIPFHIYERTPTFFTRSQGYRVRIDSTGIAALKQCLTPEHYLRLEGSCAIRTGGTAPMYVLDAVTGEESDSLRFGPKWRGKGHNEAEVSLNADRGVTRGVLMLGLEDYVSFGKEFCEFETTNEGVRVRFVDGTEVEGAMVVGADGARSRVRKQLLPKSGVFDTEGRFVFGKTVLTREIEEQFHSKAQAGLTMTSDQSSEVPLKLLIEPMRFQDNEFRAGLPDNYLYWVILTRTNKFDIDDSKLLRLSGDESAALAKKLTSHWHPSYQILFDRVEPSQISTLRVTSAKPDIPYWNLAGKATLIGDAAHVMAPTAAVGATTAIRDAAALSQALIEDGIGASSLAKYEALMRGYAKEALERSQLGGSMVFGMPPFEKLKPVSW